MPRWALIEYISHGRVYTDIAHIVRAEVDAQLDERATGSATAAIATIGDDRALASVTRLTARLQPRCSAQSRISDESATTGTLRDSSVDNTDNGAVSDAQNGQTGQFEGEHSDTTVAGSSPSDHGSNNSAEKQQPG